jgi:hypothetical protein
MNRKRSKMGALKVFDTGRHFTDVFVIQQIGQLNAYLILSEKYGRTTASWRG